MTIARPDGAVVAMTDKGTPSPAEAPLRMAGMLADAKLIGGIYRLRYNDAIVLTKDILKNHAGGVPKDAFLIAADDTDQDNEVILLRVKDVADLPHENDLIRRRMETVRRATDSYDGFGKPMSIHPDPLLEEETQQSAFLCDVLGTFHPKKNGGVRFGSDIENVSATPRYRVYVPSPAILSWIASYSEETSLDTALPSGRVTVGTVRFSSTQHRAELVGTSDAKVGIEISDFISRKTAVLGMTRAGKSNTIKTLVTATNQYSRKNKLPIGQLIFDPQGEYARINDQDKTGLKLLGDENSVRIYEMDADGTDPQTRSLAIDFFDLDNFNYITSLVCTTLPRHSESVYIKSFSSINWEEPDSDWSAKIHWTRARLGLYAILADCGFSGSFSRKGVSTTLDFGWDSESYEKFNSKYPGMAIAPNTGSTYQVTSPQGALSVASFMAEEKKTKEKGAEENEKDWRTTSAKADAPFKFVAPVLTGAGGKAIIKSRLRGFHASGCHDRVEQMVWDDMQNGRLSIINLAVGDSDVAAIVSENITNYVFEQAVERFLEGKPPARFQIVVEEAHTLFEKGTKDVANNPWVRIAKEGGKYNIGLMYATQEVTSVDNRILSNTSNWVVAHLNSKKEASELSNYQGFESWTDSIRRKEDVGFVRLKTRSGKYIVPVQVSKFDHDMINEARLAAGLAPIPAPKIEE
jgi:hypothetical protein